MANCTARLCISHPWGHGNHIFYVTLDIGNPVSSWRQEYLAILCNRLMFGGLATSLGSTWLVWHRFFSFMESTDLPTDVCHVSGMLHRQHLKSPLSTALQHQYAQHSLPTTPISLLTPILGMNFYKDNVEAFLLYTCYLSKSFIYTTKHFHSSTMLINAFFWDVLFLGNEHQRSGYLNEKMCQRIKRTIEIWKGKSGVDIINIKKYNG